mgnify:CR=1 FL=1
MIKDATIASKREIKYRVDSILTFFDVKTVIEFWEPNTTNALAVPAIPMK